MLTKRIDYVDYNGNKRSEDFFFNLTKTELKELQFTTEGGFKEKVERIVDAQDMPEIYSVFKDIVLMSYGIKSPDGKRFIKSKELSTEFTQTEAYVSLMEEITSSADKAADFINNVIPKIEEN